MSGAWASAELDSFDVRYFFSSPSSVAGHEGLSASSCADVSKMGRPSPLPSPRSCRTGRGGAVPALYTCDDFSMVSLDATCRTDMGDKPPMDERDEKSP